MPSARVATTAAENQRWVRIMRSANRRSEANDVLTKIRTGCHFPRSRLYGQEDPSRLVNTSRHFVTYLRSTCELAIYLDLKTAEEMRV